MESEKILIDLPDLFIGATALVNKLMIATYNMNHFQRITNLKIYHEK